MALWRARDVQVLISTSATASTAGDFTSATDYAGVFKSLEFTEPERETGEVKLLGATSGNANSEIFDQDPSKAELSGELVLTPRPGATTVDPSELFFTYATVSGDNEAFNYASDPATPSIMIRFGDATDYVGFILTGVKLNTLGGVTIEADGEASANIKVTANASSVQKVRGGSYSAAS